MLSYGVTWFNCIIKQPTEIKIINSKQSDYKENKQTKRDQKPTYGTSGMVLGMKCTFSTLILKNCIFFIFQTHLTIQNIALLKYAVSVLIYYSTKFISVPKLAGKMPVCLQ